MRVQVRRTRASEISAGLLSGIGGTTSAIGGPQIAILYRDSEGGVVRATLGAIFTAGIVINIAILGTAGQIRESDVVTALWLLPSLALGLWLSRLLKRRVEGERLKTAILVVSALAAVLLATRALASG